MDVDEIMGAAEKLIAQIGPPKWLQKGRAEGRAERGIELLLRLLARRFGAVPGDAVAVVRAASVEELDAMADRVLDAATLDEVLGR